MNPPAETKSGASSVIVAVESPETDAAPILERIRRDAAGRAGAARFAAHRDAARDRYVAALAARLRATAEEFLLATEGGRRHAVKSRLLRFVLGMLRA